MKQRTHDLRLNVTVNGTWTQMLNEAGAVYAAPDINNLYVEVEFLGIANIGAVSTATQVAFSSTVSVVNTGIVIPAKTLAQNEDLERTAVRILRAGEGIWVHTTANGSVAAHATVREITNE